MFVLDRRGVRRVGRTGDLVMADPISLLWVPATMAAAAAQTARNAMQRHLTAALGTLGATAVRFVYGFPFGLALLGLASLAAGRAPPLPGVEAFVWIGAGALAQILATALTLAAMRLKSFALAIAYTKAEPVLVVMFGFVVLGERLSTLAVAAIVAATAGVMVMSGNPWRNGVDGRATALGVAAGAAFGLSAVCYRGGILALDEPVFFLAATTALAWALAFQAAAMLVWLRLRAPDTLVRLFAEWRKSLFAGAMGACASGGWFCGFALAPAALVRTLGLIEVVFSLLVGRNVFKQSLAPREAAGLALMVGGVAALLLLG
jgi:drug/metabolite transporter (DMT)-like permease